MTEIRSMGRGLTLAMAAAAGLAAANLYYNQPMLGVIEAELPRPELIHLLPTATQAGYAIGLFLLVPLGDLLERRRLIVAQFLLLAGALAALASAPSAPLLLLASVLVGIGSTVAQQVVPFSAALSSPESRGKTLGTVMAGLLAGVLLSRTLAGFVASHSGWREMFWLAVPLAVGMAGLMALLLPRSEPANRGMSYGAALRSLVGLWRDEPSLRLATVIQAALFASFSAFWSVLALHLQGPQYRLGPDAAGLFGVIGLVGVFVAPLAGRLADRKGPELVIGVGAALALVSWLLFGLVDGIPAMVLGVVVLDFAVHSALVSNQHVIYRLNPAARSRINTVFMTGMFLGGAAGSAGATLAWSEGGWTLVSAFAALLASAALLLHLLRGRKSEPVCAEAGE